jgi:outer membrane protein TolC
MSTSSSISVLRRFINARGLSAGPHSTRVSRRELLAAPRSAANPIVRAQGLTLAVMLGLAAMHPLDAQAEELGASVQGLLEHARAQNPELAAMQYEADAAAQRVLPARAWPDPMLRVELMNFNNYGNDARPSLLPARVGETKYTLLQSLPTWGKRDLRRDIAAADVQQAGARATSAWTEIATRIKTGYAQYYLATGTERLTLEVLDLLTRLERLAQARYAGGLVAQQDAIRAQLEQTALRSELIALDNEKRRQRARLNALLARDTGAALADPVALRPLPAPDTFDAVTLAQRVRARNPRLLAEEARLRGAQSTSELTLRNRYPDVAVGIAPTQVGTRITTWSLMVEFNIPLQQESRRAQEQETQATVSAARSRAQALADQLVGELGENLAAIDAARHTEALIETQLLPQSEASLRSAIAAYENGKVDFATLLDAQRQIRKARQDRLKAQVEAQVRLAEIERILGDDL